MRGAWRRCVFNVPRVPLGLPRGMRITPTWDKDFHYLGIARHRKAHEERTVTHTPGVFQRRIKRNERITRFLHIYHIGSGHGLDVGR